MWLPQSRKSFKIGLTPLIQYWRVTDRHSTSHPASHVAVASTRYADMRRACLEVNQGYQTVPFHMLGTVFSCALLTLSLIRAVFFRYSTSKNVMTLKSGSEVTQGH